MLKVCPYIYCELPVTCVFGLPLFRKEVIFRGEACEIERRELWTNTISSQMKKKRGKCEPIEGVEVWVHTCYGVHISLHYKLLFIVANLSKSSFKFDTLQCGLTILFMRSEFTSQHVVCLSKGDVLGNLIDGSVMVLFPFCKYSIPYSFIHASVCHGSSEFHYGVVPNISLRWDA